MSNYIHKYLTLMSDGQNPASWNGEVSVLLDGTQPYTVTAWVRENPLSTGYDIFSKEDEFTLSVNGRAIQVFMQGYDTVETEPLLRAGDWYFIAAAYDGNGKIKIFLDGKQEVVYFVNGKGKASKKPCYFAGGLNGYIRNVKIYKQALKEESIRHFMYSEEKTDENLVHYFNFSSINPVDEITRKAVTLNECTKVAEAAPCAGFAKGTGAYPVGTRDVNPGGLGDDSYTVQAWIYIQPSSEPFATIFENWNDGHPCGMSLFLEKTDKGFCPRALHGSIQEEKNLLCSSEVLPLRTWVNLATTFNNKKLTLYVDGVQKAVTTSFVPVEEFTPDGNVRIGSDATKSRSQGENWFSGAISRIDVWEKDLTETELKKYMSETPEEQAGLRASYTFWSSYLQDDISFHPVSEVGIAAGKLITTDAHGLFTEKIEKKISRNEMQKAPEKLRKQMKENMVSIAPKIEKLSQQLMTEELFEEEGYQYPKQEWDKCRKEISESSEAMAKGAYIPLSISHIPSEKEDGGLEFYLHSEEGSVYIGAFSAKEVEALSDFEIWLIELVVIIVIGVIKIITSIPVEGASRNILNFIKNIFDSNLRDQLVPLLGGVTQGSVNVAAMDPKTIWKVLTFLYENNYIWPILRIALKGFGFWAVLAILGKVMTYLFGAGWALFVANVASLLVAVAAHIALIPKTPPVITLSQMGFDRTDTTLQIQKGKGGTSIAAPHWSQSTDKTARPVAYAIKDIRESSPKLLLQLKSTQSGNFWIRTTVTPLDAVMGTAKPKKVYLDKDKKEGTFVSMELENIKAADIGICSQNYKWNWEYSTDGSRYVLFEQTDHMVYLVLDIPTGPWSDSSPVWTEVLDYSCSWAKGIKDCSVLGKRAAVSKIAESLYNSKRFLYDTTYKKPAFVKKNTCRLSDFIQKYKSASDVLTVNHEDMAALLVSFSNALGCNLYALTLKENFKVKELLPVGALTPPAITSFSSYELAVEAEQENGQYIVTDACCRQKRPNGEEMEFALALGVPFEGDSNAYKPNFTAEPSKCLPQPVVSKNAYGRRKNI